MSVPRTPTMLRRSPSLKTKVAALTAAALAAGLSPFVAAGTAHAATFTPALNCPAETFPAAGAARSAASNPYNVPFNAELGVQNADGTEDGGYIAVAASGAVLSVVLGPKNASHTTGTLFGNACGTLNLPLLGGSIPGNPYGSAAGVSAPDNPNYNNNFALHGPPYVATTALAANPSALTTPIPVALEVPGTGVPLVPLSGTGSADGVIATKILPTPAANGGLNISFTTSAKATAVVSPTAVAGVLPTSLAGLSAPVLSALGSLTNGLASGTGGECTLTIGDTRVTGYGGSTAGYTAGVTASTANSGGTPVTGPISGAQGIATASGILQPPIDPNTQPDPLAPGAGTTAPSSLCSSSFASLLNGAFGLPSTDAAGNPMGADTFVAPVTFHAYVSQ